MGMMSITHPDILKFIEAKQDLTRFTNYNISVKIPDAWMEAYRADRTKPHIVINPRTRKQYVLPKGLHIHHYELNDLIPLEAHQAAPDEQRRPVWTMGELYDVIVHHAWQTGEPGVVFIDRINQANPTPHVGEIEATNPCGEQPLLPFEACNLGSVNLGVFAARDADAKPVYDWAGLRQAVRLATRFLDDIIEINNYPLPEITALCKANRKIGLGIMGFADALYKLGVPYNSEEGVAWGERFMKFVNDESHVMSEELARRRGCFPNWEGSTWDTVHHRPMRNACTTTVAPTGTVSIIANCSGGVEPLFSLAFFRNVLDNQRLVEVNSIFKAVAEERGFYSDELMEKIAEQGSVAALAGVPEEVKRVFVCAHDISPEWHIRMQAAFQKHCDSSISKTTNFAHSATEDDVRRIYDLAFDSGCKGVTVYRDGARENQPMALKDSDQPVAAGQAPGGAVYLAPPTQPVKTAAILSAVRIRQRTPHGHMHVSITVDPKTGRELEVFGLLGKAGNVAMSDLEAICRMVSLFLRSGGSIEHVIDQLEGIGSSLSVPTKDGRVMSLADALGKTIKKYWQAKERYGLKAILLGEVDFERLDNGNGAAPAAEGAENGASAMVQISGKGPSELQRILQQYQVRCPECGSGTLVFMEGCAKCPACGHAEC
jgi:ribonucleoside-diphosphate reductase alpha chain